MTTTNHFDPIDFLSMEDESLLSGFEKILSAVVHDLVENKELSKVEARFLPGAAIILKIKVASSDQGKLIGKEGKHIKAFQLAFQAMGKAYDYGVRLILDDPFEVNTPARRGVLTEWNAEAVTETISSMLRAYNTEFELSVIETTIALNLTVTEFDPERIELDAQEALKTLANAIGKTRGKVVELQFI